MFTGLVELVGVVRSIKTLDTSSSGGGGWSVTIGDAKPILNDCHIGDSISVNGACLTVTEFDDDSFKVGLAPETLSRTDLGELKEGSKVNLERAMATGSRYGGHFVQGHVDTTAMITSKSQDGNSVRLLFSLPKSAHDMHLYLIPKGYVAIDGTSLTLTSVDSASNGEKTFGVMLIAHTQERVILTEKNVGDRVNIEFDVVAKSVENIVGNVLRNGASGQSDERTKLLEGLVEKVVRKVLDERGVTGTNKIAETGL